MKRASRWRRGVAASLAFALAASVTLSPGSAMSSTPANRAIIDSQPDEFIAGGQTLTIPGDQMGAHWFAGELWIYLAGWFVVLRLPAGQSFAPGTYVDTGTDSPDTPEIRFFGDGSACGGGGRFVVLEAPVTNVDGVNIDSFAVDVVFHCDTGDENLALNSTIAVRIASELPIKMIRTAIDPVFPDEVVGQTGPRRPMTVTNVGDASVRVDGVTTAGTAATDFVVSDDACTDATLGPGDACVINLAFAPTQTLRRDGAVRVGFDGALDHTVHMLVSFGISRLTLKPIKATLVSDAGDPVGSGQTYVYDPAEMGRDFVYPDNILLGTAGWLIHAIATPLTIGAYPNATPTGMPHFDMTGNSTGCGAAAESWFFIRSGPTFETDHSDFSAWRLTSGRAVRVRPASCTAHFAITRTSPSRSTRPRQRMGGRRRPSWPEPWPAPPACQCDWPGGGLTRRAASTPTTSTVEVTVGRGRRSAGSTRHPRSPGTSSPAMDTGSSFARGTELATWAPGRKARASSLTLPKPRWPPA